MEGPPEGGESQGLVMVVTGGSGFLGSHLVQVLLEAEPELRELRILDVNPDPEIVPERHRSRVRFFHGDVADFGALGAVFGGARVVFHSASLVDVWGNCSPEAIARVNVLGTKNVIRACQAQGVPILVYTSSMEVVGPNTRGDPFVRGDEETPYPTRHSEPYPLSKAQAERLVLEANGSRLSGGGRLLTLSLRPTGIWGAIPRIWVCGGGRLLTLSLRPTGIWGAIPRIWLSGGGRLLTLSLRPTGIFGERQRLLELFLRRGRGLGGWMPLGLPRNAEHGRVYAGNVAWMHVLAARAARSRPASVAGEVFFCYDSSPPIPYEDFNIRLLRPAGIREFPIPEFLPGILARLNGILRGVLGALGVGFAPLLNPYTWAVARTAFTVRTDKAKKRFGFRPLFSWEEARERTVEWVKGLEGA